MEQKEFNFDSQIDAPEEIHVEDEDEELINDLFKDLQVSSFDNSTDVGIPRYSRQRESER